MPLFKFFLFLSCIFLCYFLCLIPCLTVTFQMVLLLNVKSTSVFIFVFTVIVTIVIIIIIIAVVWVHEYVWARLNHAFFVAWFPTDTDTIIRTNGTKRCNFLWRLPEEKSGQRRKCCKWCLNFRLHHNVQRLNAEALANK